MKYFIDIEFLEGTQKRRIGNIELPKYFNTKNTIDLISIGIVVEDGTEYYAISKDFNLKEAWNRWQWKDEGNSVGIRIGVLSKYTKEYWIRENILKSIFKEWVKEDKNWTNKEITLGNWDFNYRNFKYFLNKYGKTNKQIVEDIKSIIFTPDKVEYTDIYPNTYPKNIEFYGYYADYDWVAFCWLFGNMIDLPKDFPMYCIDLKQILDEKVNKLNWLYLRDTWNNSRMSIYTIGKGDSQEKDREATFEEKLKRLKELNEYPKQTNEHNALADARWNFELYKFLNTL